MNPLVIDDIQEHHTALLDLDNHFTSQRKVTRSKGICNSVIADEPSLDQDLVFYAKDMDAVQLRILDKSLGAGKMKAAVPADGRIKDRIPAKKLDVDEKVASGILHGPYEGENVAVESSSSDESSIDMPSSPHQPKGEDQSEAFIGRDTQYLRILRAFVVLGLLSAAIIVSTCIYIYTADAEEDEFRSDFNEIATKIVDSFLLDTLFKFGTARTTATTMTGLIETGEL
jgi:hypothetical protein